MTEYRKPRIFLAAGRWHCVRWPCRGYGSTPRAAWVHFELCRLARAT